MKPRIRTPDALLAQGVTHSEYIDFLSMCDRYQQRNAKPLLPSGKRRTLSSSRNPAASFYPK